MVAKATAKSNASVRIIGGKWRGRKLTFPDLADLRPTPDRVRETLFNWLQPYIGGAHCLDAFAGSGVLVGSVIVGILLFAIGGFSMVLWGVFFKTVIGWHSTWLVNSATHLWGTRRFETRDDSRNNGLIAAITFGEGWHNNHHAYPRSAKHGLAWYEFDVNWVQIWLLEKIGLIKNVYAYTSKEETSDNIGELTPIHETA